MAASAARKADGVMMGRRVPELAQRDRGRELSHITTPLAGGSPGVPASDPGRYPASVATPQTNQACGEHLRNDMAWSRPEDRAEIRAVTHCAAPPLHQQRGQDGKLNGLLRPFERKIND
jgi:hypothetical protein